jgi:hypothetical protein
MPVYNLTFTLEARPTADEQVTDLPDVVSRIACCDVGYF